MRYLKELICTIVVFLSACTSKVDDQLQIEVNGIVSSIASNMIFVEGGTFEIGDSGDGVNIDRFTNIEEIHLTKKISLDSFYISKYETTWNQYVVYMKSKGEYGKNFENPFINRIKAEDDRASTNYKDRPALAMNWESANGFCEWIGEQLGKEYSLPTEAQWEYAARSRGQKIMYAGSNPNDLVLDDYMRGSYYVRNSDTKKRELIVADDPLAKPKGNAYGHFLTQYENSIDYPAVEYYRIVGSYPPNELGLYDMSGNASEWTKDWYKSEYYSKLNSVNPNGPKGPLSWVRTTLGSDRKIPQKVVRDHLAGNILPGTSESTLYVRSGSPIDDYRNGFRCVKNISVEASSHDIVSK